MIRTDELYELSLPVFPSERRTLKEELLLIVEQVESRNK
jgi:hypothetical protein